MEATKSPEKLGSSALSHVLSESDESASGTGKPRFSVVIPLHNKARHIAACLDSVRAQTRPPFEVIVVDDASSDGSADIARAAALPGMRLLSRDTPGPGGYAARNLAIEAARGDWIAFIDADDIWLPDHLADIARLIERHPQLGCVSTRYTHVYDDRRAPSRLSSELVATADRPVDLERFLKIWTDLGECPIWTGGAAFSRETLIAAGLFPAGRATRGGDKDLWLRAVSLAPFGYVASATAEFHRDSDNKVSKITRTTAPPIIVGTARALIEDAAPRTRRLLRRLVNQQIALYARYSLREASIPGDFARQIYLPEGFRTYAMVTALRLLPASVRRGLYAVAKR